jgi:hypothetical protein
MNSNEIDVVCYSDPDCKLEYGGTMASDQVKDIIPRSKKSLFIINTDTKDLPGQHWVCIHKFNNDECEFFDSYANSPTIYPVINEGLKNLKIVNKNKYRIQGNTKEVCGEYCITYCLAKSRRVDMDDFLRHWMETEDRDELIQQMIKTRLEDIALDLMNK